MLCKNGGLKDIEKHNLDWIGQPKIDGCRMIAVCFCDSVRLFGRSGNEYTSKFPEIVKRLSGLNGIFDGEIFAGDFYKTESRVHTENKLKIKLLVEKYPSVFYIFDVLALNGEDLRNKPYVERLKKLIEIGKLNLFSTRNLKELWGIAKENGLEGIVIKNPQGKYENKRSVNLLKIKEIKSKDLKVTSYVVNSAGIRVEDDDEIAVQVSGKNSKLVKEKIDTFGFCLIEVNYMTLTENNKLRQPTFKCLKSASQIDLNKFMEKENGM